MAEPASSQPHRRGLVGNIVGFVAPAVLRQVDTNDLVDAIDVNVVAAELDVDALAERLDIDAIAQRIDVDALVERLDVNAIAADLDLDVVVERLDVNAIAQRIDVDVLVERLDVNAIAERIDVDLLVDRLDVNAIADRLDMARITAGASQDVAVSGLDLLRRQLVRADATVDGVVDRLLRRKPGDRPDAPRDLAGPGAGPAPGAPASAVSRTATSELRRRDVSGHYAGPVNRLLAVGGDVAAVVTLQAFLAWAVVYFFGTITNDDDPFGSARWFGLAVQGVVFVAWFWIPVALFGRTAAMGVLGIAVVRGDGGLVSGRRAFVRALVMPVAVLVPLALIGVVVGKRRRALQDVVAGTVVVYDWGAREAQQPVSVREQLSARVRRRQLERA